MLIKTNYTSDNYFLNKLSENIIQVKFDNKSQDILDIIFEKSFNHSNNFNYFTNAQQELKEIINQTINDYNKNYNTKSKQKNSSKSRSNIIKPWISCLKQCKTTLSNYINTETQSTAYYIRLLIHSINLAT